MFRLAPVEAQAAWLLEERSAARGWRSVAIQGSLNYAATANASSLARQGTLTIAGQTFTINVAGVICAFSLASSTTNAPLSATTGSFSFTAAASDCQWSASTNANWISITSPV